MGNFVNTNFSKTIDSLVVGSKARLNNPYYLFADRKPTVVTYWSIDPKRSTVDQGTLQVYDKVGSGKSPLRYNKINNFHLFGIDQMQQSLMTDDFGMKSPVEGEAFVLPNTIVPMVDDYFMINYQIDKPTLFQVTSVTNDTIQDGSNFYKITYALETTERKIYEALNGPQLVAEYEYKVGNVGTNYRPLLLRSDVELIDKLEDNINTLQRYYMNIFYKNNVQTFILSYDQYLLYDAYVIEFIIRNNLFTRYGNDYIHISQAVHKSDTFEIEYDNTIFKDFEDNNHNLHLNSMRPVPVHDPYSLLVDRLEDYYQTSIETVYKDYDYPINWLDMDLHHRIVEKQYYIDADNLYRNILIGWMNTPDFVITTAMIKSLMNIKFRHTKDLFYEIPLILFVLKEYINQIQINPNKIDTVSIRDYRLQDDPNIITEHNYLMGD